MSSRHDVRRGAGTTSAGGLTTVWRRSNAQEPTQLKSSQLNSWLPVCVPTVGGCESSLTATYTRRKVLSSVAPAQQWPACPTAAPALPPAGSGRSPDFRSRVRSRVRRGPTRGQNGPRIHPLFRETATLRANAERSPFFPLTAGVDGGLAGRRNVSQHHQHAPVCGLGDNHMTAKYEFMV